MTPGPTEGHVGALGERWAAHVFSVTEVTVVAEPRDGRGSVPARDRDEDGRRA